MHTSVPRAYTASSIQDSQDQFFGRTLCKLLQCSDYLRLKATMVTWLDIKNFSSPNSHAGRRNSQNKAISTRDYCRTTQAQLNPGTLSWLQFFAIEQTYTSRNLL